MGIDCLLTVVVFRLTQHSIIPAVKANAGIMYERVGLQVKLCDPLTTHAIPERLYGEVPWQTSAMSRACYFYLYLTACITDNNNQLTCVVLEWFIFSLPSIHHPALPVAVFETSLNYSLTANGQKNFKPISTRKLSSAINSASFITSLCLSSLVTYVDSLSCLFISQKVSAINNKYKWFIQVTHTYGTW